MTLTRKTTSLAGAIGIVLVGGILLWYLIGQKAHAPTTEQNVNSFEECAKHYAVMESYPARCASPDGRTFSQDIGNELEKMELIQIEHPRPTATVTSPLSVFGKARGYWFFEASFPVELKDTAGNKIAQGVAQAEGDWMTESFVPFKVTLAFPPQPSGSKGTLILHKDNPSGEASRDDALIVPIVF